MTLALSALSTRPGETSLYNMVLDGQVWTKFFPDPNHPTQWSAWTPLGPNVFPKDATVTALSTGPGETSLYIMGLDGQVWTRFFPDPNHPTQWSAWIPLGPNVFPKDATVTALSTGPGETSLYIMGLDGQVWTRFFPDPKNPTQWSAWTPLGPNVFPKDATVTALSTGPGETSLYIMGLDGQVWTRFFPDPNHPTQWSAWTPLGPNVFPKDATVTALSTGPGETSLYIMGLDGQVWTRFFPDPNNPTQWSAWTPLGPNVFPKDATVTALSTGPGEISLYIMGLDGQVWTRFFPDPKNPTQWSAWTPLGPNVFPKDATVTALSTGPGETSLYIMGLDGQVWTRFFPDPNHPAQWSAWSPLNVGLPTPNNIGLRMQYQESSEWCWIAVATAINHFYHPDSTWTQCAVMTEVGQRINGFPSPTSACPTGRVIADNPSLNAALTDPYSTAAEFILDDPRWGVDRQYLKSGSVKDPLTTTGNFAGPYHNGATTSLAQIAAEIHAGRPVAVDITWNSSTSSHVVAIAGVADDILLTLDPANGQSVIRFQDFPATYFGGAKLDGYTFTKKS